MSQENVAIIRRSFQEHAQTGQLGFAHMHPEIEWHTRADLPDSGVHRGHAGVSALVQGWMESFEDLRAEAQDYIDRGDYVVVPVVLRARVRGSDQNIAMTEIWVHKLHQGKLLEVREYLTLDEALDAVPGEV